jgi:hypothetical protein
MDVTLLVQVVDSRKHLVHDLGSVRLSKFRPFNDFVKEFSSFQEISYEVEIDVIFVNLIQLNNILMVHSLKNIDLPLKLLDFLGVINVLFLYKLDSAFKSCKYTHTSAYLAIGSFS